VAGAALSVFRATSIRGGNLVLQPLPKRSLEMTFPASVALASAIPALASASESAIHTDAPMASAVPYIEHRISHDGHMIYARD
jgi:hypothetical protein